MAGLLPAAAALAADTALDRSQVARGRYVVSTSGCNDCHTPGYPESGGKLPESQWLTGSSMGWQGAWGTTYPANLRLLMQGLTAEEWLARARKPLRPPMPWFNLRDMSDSDLRAVYAFIRSLGPAGEMAPPYALPGAVVATPYLDLTPKNLPPRQASAAK